MAQPGLPLGYKTSGTCCGIKASQSLDLALFISEHPASAAGVFTSNKVCGAPVQVSRQRVPASGVRAVIINSGNANACTGERGAADAESMTAAVAKHLVCEPSCVLVCSTGIIGHFLPMEKIEAGIPIGIAALGPAESDFEQAARAMMTTDTVQKQFVRDASINGTPVRVSGVAKGAAMIAPNMATMLAVVLTDAELTPEQADAILRHAVDRSFNCISVEGHTSTSDTVILLANGASGCGPIADGGEENAAIQQMISEVCLDLAQAIIRDAEGAEHFVQVIVRGAATSADAKVVARTIADDALVKTAITGNDPNWGRIVSACGRTGINLTERDITLDINHSRIFERGAPVAYDETALSNSMRDADQVTIEIALPFGEATANYWTSDLTQEYVRLNSEYTT
jgi:glutamate N-acetyltransferase/amino-acid N-acetyltransferase